MIQRDFIITTLPVRRRLGLWSLSGLVVLLLFSPILWSLVQNVHLILHVPQALGKILALD